MPLEDCVGAKLAGEQAAKRVSTLIPLCHPIPVDDVVVSVDLVSAGLSGSRVDIGAEVTAFWKTGVEMEALTAVQIGLLTIYDMCKAVDRGMVIESVRLLEKHGGKSGSFLAGGG